MTATVIRGPWCDSDLVRERELARLFEEQVRPRLKGMTEAEIKCHFARFGIDAAARAELKRILLRHRGAA